jgi:hypothetical protein
MARDPLKELWDSAPSPSSSFDPSGIGDLPEPARRYLEHAIAPDTPLFSTVRLRMHGEIKLKTWLPFEARQVVRGDTMEMFWAATVRQGPVVMSGYDRLIGGQGAMRWRMFGLLPLVRAEGPDVSRSAAGRLAGELCWLPTALASARVAWAEAGPDLALATFTVQGHEQTLTLGLDGAGGLRSVSFPRWGDPGGGPHRIETFGGEVRRERTFSGVTVPTEMSLGWFYGSDRYRDEGEFFRVTVDSAEYR